MRTAVLGALAIACGAEDVAAQRGISISGEHAFSSDHWRDNLQMPTLNWNALLPPAPELMPLRLQLELNDTMFRVERALSRPTLLDWSPPAFSLGENSWTVGLQYPDWSKADVFLCRRPADLPALDLIASGQSAVLDLLHGSGVAMDFAGLDLTHHWLLTPTLEAGMGQEGGGVPGQDSLSTVFLKILQSHDRATVNDHSGQHLAPNAECSPLPAVDRQCVEAQLQIGRHVGHWLPPLNDCHTLSSDVINQCTMPPVPSLPVSIFPPTTQPVVTPQPSASAVAPSSSTQDKSQKRD
ncbi:MAG: hypothetical protein K1X79_03510 [Oligoflexia bacterium]|nr:hypothetical protein [Oligoflexia bacterium]